ncbi:MAG: recombinase family protein [Actinoplanes sp.]
MARSDFAYASHGTKTKADFYGRKSTKDDGRSVASQEDEWREDCEDQGLELGRVFADPDRSASRYARKSRPNYDALLEHIRSGNCELLSMWESSRGSRDLGDWVTLLDLCRAQGVLIRVVSHDRTYDVRRRRDWRSLADDGVDSADESEKISERTRRGKRAAARAGRPAGITPFGYRRIYDDHGHFVEQVAHPDRAPILREIIARLAGGTAVSALTADLNKRGIPSPGGVRWHGQSVRKMALNPAYAGLRVHQRAVVGDATWEPLVDPVLWRTAQRRLTDPRRRTQTDSTLKHWLTAVIPCTRCSVVGLRPQGRSNGRRVYACVSCHGMSAPIAELEDAVEAALLARLARLDLAELFTAKVDDAALAAAEAEEELLTTRLDAHYAQSAAGRLTAAGLSAVEAHLLPQIEQAKRKIKRLSIPPGLAELDGVDVPSSWVDFPPSLRRTVVQATADLALAPGAPGRRRPIAMIDRLGGSRWKGETLTWAEQAASGAV